MENWYTLSTMLKARQEQIRQEIGSLSRSKETRQGRPRRSRPEITPPALLRSLFCHLLRRSGKLLITVGSSLERQSARFGRPNHHLDRGAA